MLRPCTGITRLGCDAGVFNSKSHRPYTRHPYTIVLYFCVLEDLASSPAVHHQFTCSALSFFSICEKVRPALSIPQSRPPASAKDRRPEDVCRTSLPCQNQTRRQPPSPMGGETPDSSTAASPAPPTTVVCFPIYGSGPLRNVPSCASFYTARPRPAQLTISPQQPLQ